MNSSWVLVWASFFLGAISFAGEPTRVRLEPVEGKSQQRHIEMSGEAAASLYELLIGCSEEEVHFPGGLEGMIRVGKDLMCTKITGPQNRVVDVVCEFRVDSNGRLFSN